MNTHAPLKPAAKANLRLAALLAAACLAATASAQTDLGPAAGSQAEAVSLVLRIPDTAGFQAFINGTVSAGSPQFRRFLTVGQFAARFAPRPQEVRSVIGSLEAAGIHVTDIASNGLVLRATGTVDALNRYFGVSIHQFQTTGRRYHAPLNRPRLPPAIAGSVLVVVGLSNQPVYVSRVRRVAVEPGATASAAPRLTGVATGVPGSFTVGDVARLYQVTPLYAIGVKGAGRTIGIATLATFDPADAYGYWSAIGLGVKPNRITEVPVDGGAGSAGSE